MSSKMVYQSVCPEDAECPKDAEIQSLREQLITVRESIEGLGMDHGLCEPRSRRSCTACNARDDLIGMLGELPQSRVVASFTTKDNG